MSAGLSLVLTVVLHNLPLMQVMAVVIVYVDMFRPGLANAGGDMRLVAVRWVLSGH